MNLTKEVKDLYNKNCKPLEKEIEHYRRWKDHCAHGLAESVL
jgi:hypothetical protein